MTAHQHPLTLTLACGLAAGSLILAGCGQEEQRAAPNGVVAPAPTNQPANTMQIDASTKPWVLDPSDGGKVVGAVGVAEKMLSGPMAQLQKAKGTARDELAKTLNNRIQSIFKDWFKEGGERFNGANDTVVKQEMARVMTENVSKSITNVDLSGAQQKDVWKDSSQNIYVWMVLNQAIVADAAKQAAEAAKRIAEQKSYIKAGMEADKAFEDLEKTIEKALAAGK